MKPTEEKVLNFIKKYHEEHSLMPTVREICKGLGFKSTSSVAYHLANLVEKGELTNLPNKSRAYRLTQDNALSFKAKWDMLKELIEAEKANAIHKAEQCTSGYDLLFMMANDYGRVLYLMNILENGEWNESKSPKIS